MTRTTNENRGPAQAGPRAFMRRFLSPAEYADSQVAETPEVGLRDVLRRFWPDARPFRRWIPVLLGLVALGAAIATAEIWLFKLVVDEVLVPGELGPLAWIAAAYIGLTLLGGAVSFADDLLSTNLAERFLLGLRARVFSHVQGLSIDVFDRHRSGDLISRVTGDVNEIEGLLLSGITDGLAAVLKIIFFSAALLILDWQLALIALVVGPCFLFLAKRFSKLIKHASREKRRRAGSLSAIAQENFANAALIQSANGQKVALERFRRQNEAVIDAELASTRIRGVFAPLVDMLELLAVLAVFALGTLAVVNGSLTVGGLLVFVAYLSQLLDPIRELGSISNHWFKALAGAERVIELLDTEPRVTDSPDALPLRVKRGRIELDRVDFAYPGRDERALHDVSLVIEPGETVALTGPSGAGKTTIARLALRFYDPGRGAVRIDDQDLRGVTLESLRREVSLLLQEAPLLNAPVAENIALAVPGASAQEIERVARIAGAHDFIAALPDGYATVLGERGGTLSGGQRQRVAVARALLADAPILILDEPTTGLDAASRRALIGPLRELMRDRTTLIVSHDTEVIASADRVVEIAPGGSRGGPEPVLARVA
ncbi:ABC transporter ATP-binding protein [Thermoleophilia bacterium SCSIO 60948]|nr:ABC transporter ATP-binding protein [Thermoleophilia bacterium SCSIO 60948]